jgi:hypothetical protein
MTHGCRAIFGHRDELAHMMPRPHVVEPTRVFVRSHFEEVLIESSIASGPEIEHQSTRPGENQVSVANVNRILDV